jgi:hypothetical protein
MRSCVLGNGDFVLCFVDRASRNVRVMKQPDALFIFTLLSHCICTCFGLASSPSSGCKNIYVTIGSRLPADPATVD